ncbi:hypothetical protein [Photobacterium sp. J15]|uniref:hypothetical protein n=1 Tax=Photobacterium sp. J15 TaxID=265901 RepID=UPI000A75E530|nr:hypothetical protein [Photobacterium sp. J15]
MDLQLRFDLEDLELDDWDDFEIVMDYLALNDFQCFCKYNIDDFISNVIKIINDNINKPGIHQIIIDKYGELRVRNLDYRYANVICENFDDKEIRTTSNLYKRAKRNKEIVIINLFETISPYGYESEDLCYKVEEFTNTLNEIKNIKNYKHEVFRWIEFNQTIRSTAGNYDPINNHFSYPDLIFGFEKKEIMTSIYGRDYDFHTSPELYKMLKKFSLMKRTFFDNYRDHSKSVDNMRNTHELFFKINYALPDEITNEIKEILAKNINFHDKIEHIERLYRSGPLSLRVNIENLTGYHIWRIWDSIVE